ncbi:hypothetical protein HMPREF3213_00681 [Heyndrickxia coagulans]|uniref:Uncharacterized protein n=1 Tax=Heyndrickxia coagulans TaxID=1398 RepID=A0A133L002_HEYCO|nr:hypothetical protein HMPREF3213_00681 [Heyndrickxia coagulans]
MQKERTTYRAVSLSGSVLGKLSFACAKRDYINTHVHQHK